jgi:enoyl-CoA hydratase/carnithine racemase
MRFADHPAPTVPAGTSRGDQETKMPSASGHGTAEEETVLYRTENQIAYIGMNRPRKLNAVNDHMQGEIYHAFRRADLDPAARAIVFYGEGRAFSSGADVTERQMRPHEEVERFGGVTHPDIKFLDWYNHAINWKPIITAVHGYTLGIAFAWMLRSDIAVAAEDSIFQDTETARGINGATIWTLMHFRGAGSFADEMALTAKRFSAGEALANKLVNRVVPVGEQLAAATAIATEIIANPPLAVRHVTRVRRKYLDTAQRTVNDLSEARANFHTSKDFQASTQAFADKAPTPSNWQGR